MNLKVVMSVVVSVYLSVPGKIKALAVVFASAIVTLPWSQQTEEGADIYFCANLLAPNLACKHKLSFSRSALGLGQSRPLLGYSRPAPPR